jgi:hypothetical protein
MNSKRDTIISTLQKRVAHHGSWQKKLARDDFALHLGIFREPYLTYIMEGKKRIETRFAKRPCAPFERIAAGDVVMLKPVGGDVVALCEIQQVWFYRLDAEAFAFIKDRFGKLICPADGSFWTERESKNVATLMLVKNVLPINKVQIKKRDRRGWVVYKPERELSLL